MIHRLIPPGLCMMLLGCVGDPDLATEGAGGPMPPTPAETRSVNDEPGLIVERLRILPGQTGPDPIVASLESLDSDIDGVPGFRSQGFLAMVISAAELARLESNLAPSAFAGRTWHGEATGWRSTANRRLSEGSAMLIEGRSRRISDQILTLAIRGWSIPTIDGSELYVEIVPHLEGGRLNLLQAPRQIGELRGTMLCDVLTCSLEPDECLLLISASDLETGSSEDAEATETEETGQDDGPFDGPVVALPPTAAGWLLDDPISGDRGVLLIHGRPHPAFQPPSDDR
ncbi:MAG: hypothetical protein CMJ34_11555 [Phycisphaerae bacterium]|nr:hypothetical protein [Phycisphaerae bacterium]